jgi:1,4-alpha-glucan branching enzyme
MRAGDAPEARPSSVLSDRVSFKSDFKVGVAQAQSPPPANRLSRPMVFAYDVPPGSDLTFRAWFPGAAEVVVKIGTPPDEQRHRLQTDPQAKGWWKTAVPGAFAKLEGQPYVYEFTLRDGRKVERAEGRWKLVLNSDSKAYGGEGFRNAGAVVERGNRLNIPRAV